MAFWQNLPSWPGADVIEPIETLLELLEAHGRPGTPAALPAITCIARFMSDVLPYGAENTAPVLRVIWFQDDFAFPRLPDRSVRAQSVRGHRVRETRRGMVAVAAALVRRCPPARDANVHQDLRS